MRKRNGVWLLAAFVAIVSTVLVARPGPVRAHSGEYLLVWAGDWNAADLNRSELTGPGSDASRTVERLRTSGAPGPDFLAVIDADPSSLGYGRVVRTVPVPGAENEPHHMQYSWKPGQRIFAGGLFSDTTFVFDVSQLPDVTLAGTAGPLDTPCGSVPDAYWVLSDGTALGTYMGGPNLAGDPRCNGGDSNGFAGTPGEVVRISPSGTVLGEFPAAGAPGAVSPADARAGRCASLPPLRTPVCANPHGIQAREDLGVMITSDYAEPRNVPIDPASAPDNRVFRDTVRVWDITDLENITLSSVSVMPRGALDLVRQDITDPRGVMGIMETTITNLPGHRGAFASSMCGGAIFYTPDVTVAAPVWSQVFDATVAARGLDANAPRVQGCAGAGWLQTSPDDSLLFQAVIGRSPGTNGPSDPGAPKMIYAIDIRDLVAFDPAAWTGDECAIDTPPEVFDGGAEAICPTLAGVYAMDDVSSGGPHWGTIDGFRLSADPGRISSVTRIASGNYFVARSGSDGDHRVCILTVAAGGSIRRDDSFVDEVTGRPCVDFNRSVWPHGAHGNAKPHAMLFVRATSA